MKKIIEPVQNIQKILTDQDKQTHGRKYLLLFLLISIIIHLFMLVPLITYKAHHNKILFQARLKTLPPQNKLELPASLKPKKSNFGAPVFYEQAPVIPQQAPVPAKLPEHEKKTWLPASLKPRRSQFGIPDAPEVSIKQDQAGRERLFQNMRKEETPEKNAPKTNKKTTKEKKEIKLKTAQKAIPERKVQKTTPEQPAINIAKTSTKTIGRIKDVIDEQPKAADQEKIKAKITKTLKSQEAQTAQQARKAQEAQKTQIAQLAQKAQTQQKPEENPFTRQRRPSRPFSGNNAHIEANRPAQPGKRNIIAMTKGFIENSKDEGEYSIRVYGDDNKRPSFEDLKYLSYNERIVWQFQAVCKSRHSFPLLRCLPQSNPIIGLIIDSQGNLTTAELLQSCGVEELDTVIVECLKKASPFPPLPKHFGRDTYILQLLVEL